MCNPYKYKIDEVYASLKKSFKIEDDGELNKYLVIDLGLYPYESINLSQPDIPKESST